MDKFWSSQLRGSAILVASCFNISLQNFLVPRFLGSLEYGLVVSLLSLPFFIQGLWESIVMFLAISWFNSKNKKRISFLFRDTILVLCIGFLLISFFTGKALNLVQNQWKYIFLCWIVFFLFISTTLLTAFAYAQEKYEKIFKSVLISGLVFLVILVTMRNLKSIGYFIALIIKQIVAIAMLKDGLILNYFTFESLKLKAKFSIFSSYISALLPRLINLFLTTGMIVIAAVMLDLKTVAVLKVTISLLSATIYLIPISPQAIQAVILRTDKRSFNKSFNKAIRFILIAFILGVFLAFILYILGDKLVLFILKEDNIKVSFKLLFIAVPAFILIRPLSAVMFAINSEKYILEAFIFSFIPFIFFIVLSNFSLAFVTASYLYVLFLFFAVFKNRYKEG